MKSFFMRSVPVLIAACLVLAACSANPTAAPVPATDQGSSGQANPTPAEAATVDPNVYPAPEQAQAASTEAVAAGYPNPLPEGALFVMTLPDGSVVYPTAEDLGKLTQVEITADGQSKTGVKVGDLLAVYNVTKFHMMGVEAPDNSIALTPEKLNDETILEQTGAGSVNLISSGLPAAQWILGVTKIVVQ